MIRRMHSILEVYRGEMKEFHYEREKVFLSYILKDVQGACLSSSHVLPLQKVGDQPTKYKNSQK